MASEDDEELEEGELSDDDGENPEKTIAESSVEKPADTSGYWKLFTYTVIVILSTLSLFWFSVYSSPHHTTGLLKPVS